MFNKIKAIQELKTQANQIKKVLAEERIEGSGGWGKVKLTMDGNQEVLSVDISNDIVGDKTKTENAVKEAINDTIKKAQRVMAQKMSQMGGIDLPGLK
jgi:nucleoid-associated protein EbfC